MAINFEPPTLPSMTTEKSLNVNDAFSKKELFIGNFFNSVTVTSINFGVELTSETEACCFVEFSAT